MSYNYNQDLKDVFVCDFLLSIGKHCRPAIQLRKNDLRLFSSPLDWMGGYTLDIAIMLYKTNFKSFFEKYKVDENKFATSNTFYVIDTKNSIFSIHHFKKDKDINETYTEFKSTMKKRANRLKDYLEASKDLVLVAERDETRDEMLNFLKSFSTIYSHLNIRLISFIHDGNIDFLSFKEQKVFDNGKLSYIEYSLNDTMEGKESVNGNDFVWNKILSNYRLRDNKD